MTNKYQKYKSVELGDQLELMMIEEIYVDNDKRDDGTDGSKDVATNGEIALNDQQDDK